MPQKQQPALPNLTPGQARYVLMQLVEEGKTNYNELVKYAARMNQEIRDLESRLQLLKGVQGGEGVAAGAAEAAPARRRRGRPAKQAQAPAAAPVVEEKTEEEAPTRQRRRRRVGSPTAQQLASRKLQGEYLGLLMQVPKNKREHYQKLSRDKGREAAIARLRKELKRK